MAIEWRLNRSDRTISSGVVMAGGRFGPLGLTSGGRFGQAC